MRSARQTSRPPFSAEKFAHLAGRSFEPVRETAMHHSTALSQMNTRDVTLEFRPNMAFRQNDGTVAAVVAG